MSIEQRNIILNLLRDDKQKRFICSVRTISVGVNLPWIDSVVFWANKSSVVDIIQCIGRAQREYKGKKISNVYVVLHNANNKFKRDKDAGYGDDYQLMKGIRKFCRIIYEYDPLLKNKIKVFSFRGQNGPNGPDGPDGLSK